MRCVNDPDGVCRQYRPLVCKIARTYWYRQGGRKYAEIGDLQSAGYIGLLYANRRYTPGQRPFFPYAELAIAREIRRELERYSPYRRAIGLAYKRDTQRRRSGKNSQSHLDADITTASEMCWSDVDKLPLAFAPNQEVAAEFNLYSCRLRRQLSKNDPRGWVSQYIWNGYSMPEIARISGVSYQCVQQVISKILSTNSDLALAAGVLKSYRKA